MNKINPFLSFDENIDILCQLYKNENIKLMYPIEGIIDIVPNKYYITDYGRIFKIHNNYIIRVGISINQDGYETIYLQGINNSTSYFVHRLVMIYYNFRQDCNNLVVDHIDRIRYHNHISNLRWVTQAENNLNKDKSNRIFSVEDIIDIKRRLYEGESQCLLAKEYNIHQSMISEIKLGRLYSDIKTEYDDIVKNINSFQIEQKISDQDILNIYNKSKECINDELYAKEYNISPLTIKNIRRVVYPYNKILKDKDPILESRLIFTDEEALNIYERCKNEKVEDIAKELEVDKEVVGNIKYVRESYKFLAYKYNLKPQKNPRKHTSEELAIEVYKALSYMSCKEAEKKFGLSEKTVSNIKFCLGYFSFLTEKYGLKPYPRKGEY